MLGNSGMSGAFNNGRNGRSIYGNDYTACETWAHCQGLKARESAMPSANSVNAHIVAPAPASSGDCPEWLLVAINLLFFLGFAYGVLDSAVHHASPLKSAAAAFISTSEISDHVGQAVRKLGPDSTAVAVLDGLRWTVGFVLASEVGLGAATGGGVVSLTRALFHD